MKLTYIISILFVTISFFSCSSIEVTSSWKSDEMVYLKDKNVLVIARTNRPVIREKFEDNLVEELERKGIKSSASYRFFDILNPDKKLTKEETLAIREFHNSELDPKSKSTKYQQK